MKRLLLAAVMAGASALAAPAAHATRPDVIDGGCFFNTVADPSTSDVQVGVIGDVSVTRTGDVPFLPIDATVSCWVEVNGVEAPGTRFSYSGPGAQEGADRASYTAADGAIVALCQSVEFADGTSKVEPCPTPLGPFQVPPQPILDLLGATFDFVDSTACPSLVAVAGTYGPVTIGPDGDVYAFDPFDLGLNPVYDCPPHEGS